LKNLRVAILTTLFNKDDLRSKASNLKVSVINFVPKDAHWEGNLLLTVSRLCKEIENDILLPALPPWRLPIIQVQKRTDLRVGRINIVVNGIPFFMKSSERGRLLGYLLKNAEKEIRYRDIDKVVEGKRVSNNERKKWINYIRTKIRKDWLKWPNDSPDHPERKILETVNGGIVLHAHVEGLTDE
jgi:hypothetical protein